MNDEGARLEARVEDHGPQLICCWKLYRRGLIIILSSACPTQPLLALPFFLLS